MAVRFGLLDTPIPENLGLLDTPILQGSGLLDLPLPSGLPGGMAPYMDADPAIWHGLTMAAPGQQPPFGLTNWFASPLLPQNPSEVPTDPGPSPAGTATTDQMEPRGNQEALEWYERMLIPDSEIAKAKTAIHNLTEGVFSPDQLDQAVREILRNIKSEDAMHLLNINPGASQISLNRGQFDIISRQLDTLSPELRETAREGLRRAQASGRVRCTDC